jgi:acylphosphatase
MLRHLNITVSGEVQGVFFRATAKDEADAIGVRGFVRNEKDGSVYIEVEGEKANLDRFVSWCRKGPPRSVVNNVEVVDGTVVGFNDFAIRRY